MHIFAHRGFSGKYPENTMLAFEKAVELGCYGIEMDIHLSKDNQIVIIHDELLKRTCNKAGKVSDYTLAELQSFNAPAAFGSTFGSTPLPSFEEYCDYIRNTNIVTNVEIKTNLFYYSNIEEKFITMIKKYKLEDQVIVSSFNPFSIVRIKQIAPEIKCGFLTEKAEAVNLAALLAACHFEYYHPDFNLLNTDIVNNFKSENVGINVWTVNEEKDIKQAIEWNLTGIISNYPDKCINYIKS